MHMFLWCLARVGSFSVFPLTLCHRQNQRNREEHPWRCHMGASHHLPEMSQPSNVSALLPSPQKSEAPQAKDASWPRVLGAVPEPQVLRQVLGGTGELPLVKSPCATGETSTQDYGPTLGTNTVTERKLGLLASSQ